MRVRFVRDEIYETEGRGKGPRYRADHEYDLPDDLAQRWLRRGAAIVSPDPEPPEPEAAPQAAAEPPQEPEPPPEPEPHLPVSDDDPPDIPEDWREQHHSTRIALARRLSGAEVTSASDADAIIAEEVERRQAAHDLGAAWPQ